MLHRRISLKMVKNIYFNKKYRFQHILMVAFSVLLTILQTINNKHNKTTIKLQVP